jgi:GAF domain-containing protein
MVNNFYKYVKDLINGIDYEITLQSQLSSFLYSELENINWLGFYLYVDEILILGPFAGHPACLKIKLGDGVCGTSALERVTQNVPNVNNIKNYISCSSETQSELVIPIIINDNLYGVLDIDSNVINRFDEELVSNLEDTVKLFVKRLIEIKTN